jgi:hypothetical protein
MAHDESGENLADNLLIAERVALTPYNLDNVNANLGVDDDKPSCPVLRGMNFRDKLGRNGVLDNVV